MKVLEPYKAAFDHAAHPEDEDEHHIHDTDAPPHRHLFRCYVYQYHLTQFAEIVIETVSSSITLTISTGLHLPPFLALPPSFCLMFIGYCLCHCISTAYHF